MHQLQEITIFGFSRAITSVRSCQTTLKKMETFVGLLKLNIFSAKILSKENETKLSMKIPSDRKS